MPLRSSALRQWSSSTVNAINDQTGTTTGLPTWVIQATSAGFTALVRGFSGALSGALLVVGMISLPAQAKSPATAPPELTGILSQIDSAASSQDLPQVMEFFSDTFTNSDGLTRQTLEQFLSQFWKDYTQVSYRTELVSWEQQGTIIIADTVTRITATRQADGRIFRLQASLKARQHLDNRHIVQQDIVAEQSQLSSGSNPPTVTINLPAMVAPGQSYNFDAIVQEPLGEDFLLGSVTDQPIQADRYAVPAPSTLQALPSGGIFKVGRAPQQKDDRWISAILIRQGGITIVTQRLRVTDSK